MNDREREHLEATIARQEDALFRSTSQILSMRRAGLALAAELDRLAAEVDRLAKTPNDFAAANRARKAAADHRAAIAQQLLGEGKSPAVIAKMAKVSVRTVERWRKRDTT